MNSRTRLWLVLGITSLIVAAVFVAPAMPLDPDYHSFADRRTIFGIPNALNVLSNIAFVIAGLWGVSLLVKPQSAISFSDKRERFPYLVFFLGVFLSGIGSAFYHLAPSDERLLYDLLPMTIAFTSILAAVIVDRVNAQLGLKLLAPLLMIGVASVLYWSFTADHGAGDLRFYLLVKYYPLVGSLLLILLFTSRYTETNSLLIAFGLCLLAALCQILDQQIYDRNPFVSGHTLKHFLAGLASYWILRMLLRRRPATDPVSKTGGTNIEREPMEHRTA
jgi:hypothetical protein